MSIVSRTLTNRGVQVDGKVRVLERIIDSKGRRWDRVYKAVSEAQAITDMNARVLTEELADADRADLLQWVQARNTVADFDYTNRDIDQDAGEEHIFQHFAESQGAKAILVAWWMDDINTGKFNAIRDRIGYTGTQGADITSRFTFLVAVEPWYEFTVEAP